MTPEEVQQQYDKTKRTLYASTTLSKNNCRLESNNGNTFAWILVKRFKFHLDNPHDPNYVENKKEDWEIVGCLDFSKTQKWIEEIVSYKHDLHMFFDTALEKWRARCTCENFHPDWGTTEEITQAFRQHRLDLGLSI